MFYRFITLLTADLNPVLGPGTAPAPAPAAGAAADAAGTAAPAVGEAVGGGLFGSPMIWIFYIAIFVGMYFLLMRPQRKREKQMKELQASIRVGDNIVTNGGLYGRVADVGDDAFVIEFGTNRSIKIPVRKSDVLGIKEPKLTPPPKTE